MHSIDLHVSDGETTTAHHFKLPGSWEECSTEQFLAVLAVRAIAEEDTDVRFALVRLLAQIPDELMQHIQAEDVTELVATDEGDQWVVFPQVSWALEVPKYTVSKLPTIEHGGTTWSGPDDELQTWELNQYVFTTSLLNMYRDSAEEVDLNHFLASAYQPKGTPWSNLPIEELSLRLADLPVLTKLLAVRNYEALHAMLPARYPITFDGSGGGESSPLGLAGIAYDVAKSGTFGPLPEVERTNVHKVLGYVEHSSWKDRQRGASTPAAPAS